MGKGGQRPHNCRDCPSNGMVHKNLHLTKETEIKKSPKNKINVNKYNKKNKTKEKCRKDHPLNKSKNQNIKKDKIPLK